MICCSLSESYSGILCPNHPYQSYISRESSITLSYICIVAQAIPIFRYEYSNIMWKLFLNDYIQHIYDLNHYKSFSSVITFHGHITWVLQCPSPDLSTGCYMHVKWTLFNIYQKFGCLFINHLILCQCCFLVIVYKHVVWSFFHGKTFFQAMIWYSNKLQIKTQ